MDLGDFMKQHGYDHEEMENKAIACYDKETMTMSIVENNSGRVLVYKNERATK